jgi:hypothetical protein
VSDYPWSIACEVMESFRCYIFESFRFSLMLHIILVINILY